MADITMCQGVKEHTQCENCYRRVAPINPHWQAYFIIQPILEQEDKTSCEYYTSS